MARGAESKQKMIDFILQNFEGAFMYGDKELRVPFMEDGNRVEIKVALTCAKTNVGGDAAPVENGATVSAFPTEAISEPTAEEKQNIADLLSKLGL